MSDEYGDLYSLERKVIEEAIYAELRVFGWYPDGNGGVYESNVGLGASEPRPVPAPGQGVYPDEVITKWIPTGDGDYGDGGTTLPTVGAVYQKWEERIPPVFEPFYGFPEPSDFGNLAEDVRQALSMLSSQGNAKPAGAPAGIDYEGNTTLGLANDVAQKLNGWQGAAATSFATYLNLFTGVVANQALAAEVLRICLYMEQEMWTRMRSDVVTLAKDAAAAYSQAGQISGDDIKSALSVISTVTTVAGWFPAFKPVTEVVSKGATVTGLLVDTFAGETPPESNLSDFQWTDIFPKLQSAAKELTEKSVQVEKDIQTSLNNLKNHVSAAMPARANGSADQESFKLDRPNTTYSADDLSDFIFPGVVVNPQTVRDAAHSLDTDLYAEMTAAGNALVKSDAQSYWYRSDGSIGVGTFGAASDYSDACDLLSNEILETANEMQWAAEMLRAVAADLEGTDDNVGDDFAATRTKIRGYDDRVAPAPDATTAGR